MADRRGLFWRADFGDAIIVVDSGDDYAVVTVRSVSDARRYASAELRPDELRMVGAALIAAANRIEPAPDVRTTTSIPERHNTRD